jgi:tetratricopeptide (TPR) repeat protein
MKKYFFFSLFVFAALANYAADANVFETEHFSVTSYVSPEDAENSAKKLEAFLGIFNGYFHFSLDKIQSKLKVKIFETKARFDTYVQRLIGETRDDYVYLHYSNQARSELVGYTDEATKASDAGIAHQAFVQYIRAFVPNSPLWLREGFGVYFESLNWDITTQTATENENLSWLETFKAIQYGDKSSSALTLDEVLTISSDDAKTKIQSFFPQSWGLVHYLANTQVRDHSRILWDTIVNLDPAAALIDNSNKVKTTAFGWVASDSFTKGMQDYYTAKKTFPELVKEGIELYSNGKLKDAELVFTKAATSNPSSYVPPYYLGLINYDNGQYTKAEEFYSAALEKGAGPAQTTYALGVNAFADNRYDAAKAYFERTVVLDASFTEKTAEILKRMDLEGTSTSSSGK